MPTANVSMTQVFSDLANEGGNKAKLMQKYCDRQAEIIKQYGGSISDIPVNDPDHEYFKIQAKLGILHRLCQQSSE